MAEEDYPIEIITQNTSDFELSFKMIIIGDSGVGKSCLSIRGTKDVFEPMYSPTIGFEFMAFYVKVNGQTIKLQIWDTCGQEVYRSLISSFYNNSSLAIIVYSIDSKESFNNLEFWLNELRVKANPDINIFVIGNKCDLEDKRQITKDMAREFCENNKIKLFLETSAKTGFNAQNIFIEASKLLYEQQLRNKMRISNSDSFQNIARDTNNSFPMDDIYEDDKNKKRKKCC
jgi:small GTP-binding protein